MVQTLENNNNCSTCTHSNVCAYKSLFKDAYDYTNDDSIAEVLKDSPIQINVTCNEYHSTLAHFAKTCSTMASSERDQMSIINEEDMRAVMNANNEYELRKFV